MKFYEIKVTGYKHFIVEADSQDEALSNEVVSEEMSDFGDIDWEADQADAELTETPNLESCKIHGIKVFDKDGIEYS